VITEREKEKEKELQVQQIIHVQGLRVWDEVPTREVGYRTSGFALTEYL